MALTVEREVQAFVVALRKSLAKESDALAAAVHAHEIVEAWMGTQPELAQLRIDMFRRATESGASHSKLAEECGVSRQRIGQILSGETVRGSRPKDKPKNAHKEEA
jgi:hypothetical protein